MLKIVGPFLFLVGGVVALSAAPTSCGTASLLTILTSGSTTCPSTGYSMTNPTIDYTLMNSGTPGSNIGSITSIFQFAGTSGPGGSSTTVVQTSQTPSTASGPTVSTNSIPSDPLAALQQTSTNTGYYTTPTSQTTTLDKSISIFFGPTTTADPGSMVAQDHVPTVDGTGTIGGLFNLPPVTPGNTNGVPEPATVTLLGTALAGLWIARRLRA